MQWGSGVEEFAKTHGTFEAIVGADVVFIESQIAPLLTTLMALSTETTDILICTEMRDLRCFEAFVREANLLFEVTRVQAKKLSKVLVHENVVLHRLKKRKPPTAAPEEEEEKEPREE